VKRGFERQICMSLINKSIAFAQRGSPLAILSVTCSENVEGFVYVEAFKEIHVRDAIKGLSAVLGGKVQLVELGEMTGIYYNNNQADKQLNQLKPNHWVRIKSGFYHDDLGLVQGVCENGKVWLKLIPRLDMTSQKDPKSKPSRFMSYRPP